jgi:hypothetical protein
MDYELVDELLKLADECCKKRNVELSTLGGMVAKDGKFFVNLKEVRPPRKKRADCTTNVYLRVKGELVRMLSERA